LCPHFCRGRAWRSRSCIDRQSPRRGLKPSRQEPSQRCTTPTLGAGLRMGA
jgi:hypothetical protein